MHYADTTHCIQVVTTLHLSSLCKWEQTLVLEQYICFVVCKWHLPFAYFKGSFKISFASTYIIVRDIYSSIKEKFPPPHQEACNNSQSPSMQPGFSLKPHLWKQASIFITWGSFGLGKGGGLEADLFCLQSSGRSLTLCYCNRNTGKEQAKSAKLPGGQSWVYSRLLTSDHNRLCSNAKKQAFIPD